MEGAGECGVWEMMVGGVVGWWLWLWLRGRKGRQGVEEDGGRYKAAGKRTSGRRRKNRQATGSKAGRRRM